MSSADGKTHVRLTLSFPDGVIHYQAVAIDLTPEWRTTLAAELKPLIDWLVDRIAAREE